MPDRPVGEERTEAATGAADDPTTWPPPEGREAPEGCVLVWEPEPDKPGWLHWVTVKPTHSVSDRCRYTVGPGYATCKRPAVAWLNRARQGRGYPLWFPYCERHLYGRRICNGQVWHCVAMVEASADA